MTLHLSITTTEKLDLPHQKVTTNGKHYDHRTTTNQTLTQTLQQLPHLPHAWIATYNDESGEVTTAKYTNGQPDTKTKNTVRSLLPHDVQLRFVAHSLMGHTEDVPKEFTVDALSGPVPQLIEEYREFNKILAFVLEDLQVHAAWEAAQQVWAPNHLRVFDLFSVHTHTGYTEEVYDVSPGGVMEEPFTPFSG